MNTKLRLLLDECVQAKLIGRIKEISGISKLDCITAEYSGASDAEVVAYAKRKNMIIVTVEGGLNEHKFKFGSHCGIIVLASNHDSINVKLFKKLMLSGERKNCWNSVTKLKLGGSIRLEQNPDGSIRKSKLEI